MKVIIINLKKKLKLRLGRRTQESHVVQQAGRLAHLVACRGPPRGARGGD